MSPQPIELSLQPDEAIALWFWLNCHYPDSREAMGSALDKLADEMDRAGIDTDDFSSKFEGGPPYLASGV